MKYIDVFNGDADGICALHQLRLAQPQDSELVTGVKRDISLLNRVQAGAGDQLTVLDISLDKNREALQRLLDCDVNVQYFDHHFSGDIPESSNLDACINTDANVCSSLLVNDYLENKYLAWAVTAAYGDNLFDAAIDASQPLRLSEKKLEQLKLLGTCLNYNGYGSSLDDLIFNPEALYRMVSRYEDPFDFIENEASYKQLLEGYSSDFKKAEELKPVYNNDHHALFILPEEKWARRVSGVYANDLAQNNPDRAHAMLTEKKEGGYVISVRAPLNNKMGADDLCRQFETGGGRKAAAGINHLPNSEYEHFISVFKKSFIQN
jgi:hypothetical protein